MRGMVVMEHRGAGRFFHIAVVGNAELVAEVLGPEEGEEDDAEDVLEGGY